MKIIRYDKVKAEKRLDGREIYSLISYGSSGIGKVKFFRVKIPKGVIEEEHYHTCSDEIFILLKPGWIVINQKRYNFKEGDIVIFEKNDKHKIIAKEDMEVIGLKIPDVEDKVVIK